MKFLFAVSTLLAVAVAQDLSSLPACGQLCVNNMLGLAPSLGCAATDAKCLCSNANFAHGLNDCSVEACGAAVQAQVVAFGTSYCSAAGVPLGGAGGNTAGGAGTATGTATGTGGTATGTATGTGGTATGSAASSAASALSSADKSASSALASVSSSVNSVLSTATKTGSSSGAASGAASSGAGSSSTAKAFAMHTAAPLAGVGAFGLAAILLV